MALLLEVSWTPLDSFKKGISDFQVITRSKLLIITYLYEHGINEPTYTSVRESKGSITPTQLTTSMWGFSFLRSLIFLLHTCSVVPFLWKYLLNRAILWASFLFLRIHYVQGLFLSKTQSTMLYANYTALRNAFPLRKSQLVPITQDEYILLLLECPYDFLMARPVGANP